MISNKVTATALLASAPLANALGHAVVKNACKYEVKLCNVPASGGGFEQIDKMLQPDETYTQQYEPLSNDNGWSIKLSQDDTLDHILQYEYTTHQDGIIWYDLSEVDGNPWDGNWEITTDNDNCNPKQQAYRYATDDAYGMQSCPDDADIMVTLCSGEDDNDQDVPDDSVSASSSAPVSSEAATSAAATSAPAYGASASYPASSSVSSDGGLFGGNWGNWGKHKEAAQATTLATMASAAPSGNVVTVTQYSTIYAREAAPTRHAHRRHGHA